MVVLRSRALNISLLMLWIISLSVLSFILFLLLFHLLGIFLAWDLTHLLVNRVAGNIIVAALGLSAILFSLLMLLNWLRDQRWKDLRYKMAFYLYHSRVKRGQMIPLDHLADVAICSFEEICTTLEMMIGRGELKGMVDREKRIYKHLGITKKGMKFLLALPPAKLDGLDDIRRLALKGAAWYEGSEGGSVLPGPAELERLPTARPEGTGTEEAGRTICPFCKKVTPSYSHFCTFCGEEFDGRTEDLGSEYYPPEDRGTAL